MDKFDFIPDETDIYYHNEMIVYKPGTVVRFPQNWQPLLIVSTAINLGESGHSTVTYAFQPLMLTDDGMYVKADKPVFEYTTPEDDIYGLSVTNSR